MTLENVQYPYPKRNWRAGGRNIYLSFFFFIYFFIVDITQSHLYTYYIIITLKKRVISLIKISIMYIFRVHEYVRYEYIHLVYMSLMIHINYYNILIIKRTICP